MVGSGLRFGGVWLLEKLAEIGNFGDGADMRQATCDVRVDISTLRHAQYNSAKISLQLRHRQDLACNFIIASHICFHYWEFWI